MKKWFQMNYLKYCPSLATTVAHLSGRARIPIGKSVHLLRLSTNQAIFRCLLMSGTADQPGHVLSTGTSSIRTEQYLGTTAAGVGLPIWAFAGRF